MKSRVPVHVIAGFLGAGKTTVLCHLIEQRPEERAAVVMNDFGESAVDEHKIDALSVTIREIRGGWVCCTAPEGFMGAVKRILDEQDPDRIYVEPTGLARPADLIDTLRRAPFASRLDIRPLVVVVDPHALVHVPSVGAQASVADVIVANRVDLATSEEMGAFEAWLDDLWPAPRQVHRVTRGGVPAAVLVGVARPQEGVGHVHDGASVHGHYGRTWRWPAAACFDRRRLCQVLDSQRSLSRLKGIFRTEEGVSRFDIAGGRLHEAPSDYRTDSCVDVIGSDPEGLERIGEAFERALRTEAETLSAGHAIEVSSSAGERQFDRAALAALPDGISDVSTLLHKRVGSAARMSALLDAVDAPQRAHIVVVAADGYTTPPVPASAVRAGLLVYGVGADALPEDLGGPFRLLIPGDAGPGGPCANVKAVVRIALRDAEN